MIVDGTVQFSGQRRADGLIREMASAAAARLPLFELTVPRPTIRRSDHRHHGPDHRQVGKRRVGETSTWIGGSSARLAVEERHTRLWLMARMPGESTGRGRRRAGAFRSGFRWPVASKRLAHVKPHPSLPTSPWSDLDIVVFVAVRERRARSARCGRSRRGTWAGNSDAVRPRVTSPSGAASNARHAVGGDLALSGQVHGRGAADGSRDWPRGHPRRSRRPRRGSARARRHVPVAPAASVAPRDAGRGR